MKVPLALIVEGHGEVSAVPVLLRRLLFQIDPRLELDVRALFRVPATKLRKKGELERHVELAARTAGTACRLLILLDCDDHCPRELGPELLRRARNAREDLAPLVILAHREFESWFLAAARSLRGRRGLPEDLDPPSEPETIRGAKEWLTKLMKDGRRYEETVDQAAFAALFDLTEASQAKSFARLERKLRSLIEIPPPS